MGHRQDTRQRSEVLARLHVLRHCDPHELRALAAVSEPRRFGEGEALCRRGDAAEEVYLLVAGHLGVTVDGDLVATLAPGAVAGELGPLGPAVRCADLVGLTAGEVFAVPATALRRLLSESPGLRKGITPVLAARARENDHRAD